MFNNTNNINSNSINAETFGLSNLDHTNASLKVISFPCGCETARCFQRGDCTAKHDCKVCPDKVLVRHCGTHKGTPDIFNSRVYFV